MKEKLLHIMSFVVLVAFFSILSTSINAAVPDVLRGVSVPMALAASSGSVTTRYIDIVTRAEIAQSKRTVGNVGTSYTTSSVPIANYVLEVTPSNANGVYATVPTIVNYEYRKQLTVTTKYVDIVNNTIIESTSKVYGQEAEYRTTKKTFTGYEYVSDTGNTIGNVGATDIEVTYYYKKNTGTVVTKYVDVVDGHEVAPEVVTSGLEGEPYKAKVAEPDRYTLEVVPSNNEGVYTDGQIVVTYQYRKKSYVTTMYKDIVNNKFIATEDIQDLKQGVNYSTESKFVTGYTCVGDSRNTTGTVGATDITVTYNYKKNSAPVYTKYVDIVTGKEISEHDSQTGLEGEDYFTTPKTVAGYVLEVTPSNATGAFATSDIEVVYQYRKQLNVVTRYVDAVSGENLITPITEKYLEEKMYTTDDSRTFPNYTATGNSGNTSGVVGPNDIEVVYYYKKNSAPVVTKFKDICSGAEIATSVSQTGLEAEPYKTAPITIDGYVLEVTPENAEGNYAITEIEVVYEYRKQVNVITEYIDEVNNVNVHKALEKTYLEEDEYTTDLVEYEGYTFTRDSGNTTGVVGPDTITVTYYYKKNNATVYTNFIDVSTKETIAESKVQTGLESNPYETEPIEIEGYVLEITPENANGEFAVGEINVNYEYRKQSDVITRHVDANTGAEITDSTSKTYLEGNKYVTGAVNVEGYVLTETPDNKAGTVGREDIEVIYLYKKVSSGIIVKYVDMVNNEILDTKLYQGNEKDRVDFIQEEFNGYVMVKAPDVTYAEMSVGVQEFVYYYYKNISLLVNGIDKDTRKVLWSYTVEGVEGESYTTEPRDVAGYTLVKIPETANGVHSRNNTVVYYEYSKNALLGDVNMDGFINSTDAAYILDRFKNQDATSQDLLYGDMNKDNILNSTDAAMILDIFKSM